LTCNSGIHIKDHVIAELKKTRERHLLFRARNRLEELTSNIKIKAGGEKIANKPSEKEQEYIARKEFEKLQKLKAEAQKKLAEKEKNKLIELHHMRCPKCGMELIEIDYRSIMIDKCSQCEGIWLDAGEFESVSKLEKSGLDKLFSVFKKV
jgi:hypothetical protein